MKISLDLSPLETNQILALIEFLEALLAALAKRYQHLYADEYAFSEDLF